MILGDFLKALAQLPDPRFRRVLWLGIGGTLALLVAAYAALLWLIDAAASEPVTLPWIGQVTWIGDLLGWGSLGLMLLLSVFLMIPVASAITSFFLDDVADAVEARHYPALPPVPRTSFWDGLRDTFAFLGLMLVANLVAIALYLLFPPAAPLIFYTMNGFLLGREYFQVAAMRREGRAGARSLGRRHRAAIWVAGILMALPLSIPLLNLFVPILGAATFTHLYHRLTGPGARVARYPSGRTSPDRAR
ncbi:EI24 domain-containing protein [Loktanella sp. DJP18]|uniref:EI24 domain-containing protein n=1 Tax=Loktanella sp. DJP18 TaxID=3409788 RepID=UPI003BB7204F